MDSKKLRNKINCWRAQQHGIINKKEETESKRRKVGKESSKISK